MNKPAEYSDRRRFERLELSDDAIAVDETGRELGKVTQASGGGMLVVPKTPEIASSLAQGQRVQVTVLEPSSQTRHTIDMVVRYASADKIGLEFVGGKA